MPRAWCSAAVRSEGALESDRAGEGIVRPLEGKADTPVLMVTHRLGEVAAFFRQKQQRPQRIPGLVSDHAAMPSRCRGNAEGLCGFAFR